MEYMVCRIKVENHIIYTQGKVTNEIEQEILDLRVTKRFDCNRIRFRLKRLNKISLSTRTTINVIKKDQERQILIKNIFNSHENPDSEFYLMVYEEKIVTEIADTLDNIALDINKNHILNS